MLTRFLIPLVGLLLGGCALGPSDPYELGVGLAHKGGGYYIQLAGGCEYPEGTGVLVRDDATGNTLWDATLRAGKSADLLLIGKSSQVISEKTPLESLASVDSISVLISDNKISWDNSFKLKSVGPSLNGGEIFDDKNISLAQLNQDSGKVGACT